MTKGLIILGAFFILSWCWIAYEIWTAPLMPDDFELKEEVVIKIVNSGTVPLTFNDASYGLRITGLDGVLYYTPMAAQVISELEPKDEIIFVWDQQKLDGSYSLEGRYKITTEGFDPENNKVKKSIVINVLK